jgi:hypothetical protein
MPRPAIDLDEIAPAPTYWVRDRFVAERPNTQLAIPGLAPRDDRAVTGWRAGDRVQLSPGSATGTIERLRGDVAEVLWDTGARCPVPLAWIAEPTNRPTPGAAAARERRHETDAWKRAHRPQRCNGCGRVFRPKRAGQLFCTAGCRKRAHRNGSVAAATKAVASRDASPAPPAVTTPRVCSHCGEELGSMRSDARYCGAACRKAAERERKRRRS